MDRSVRLRTSFGAVAVYIRAERARMVLPASSGGQMHTLLTPIERCQQIAGLEPHEIVIGVAPAEKHERMLAKYRGVRISPAVARTRLVADLRAALRAGATGEAADLLIVLRQLLSLDGLRSSTRPAQRRSRATPARVIALRPRVAKEVRSDGAVILPFAAR